MLVSDLHVHVLSVKLRGSRTRGRCVQRRPIKRGGEEGGVVSEGSDRVFVRLKLISRRILRQKDGVVASRTDRARQDRTTGR